MYEDSFVSCSFGSVVVGSVGSSLIGSEGVVLSVGSFSL